MIAAEADLVLRAHDATQEPVRLQAQDRTSVKRFRTRAAGQGGKNAVKDTASQQSAPAGSAAGGGGGIGRRMRCQLSDQVAAGCQKSRRDGSLASTLEPWTTPLSTIEAFRCRKAARPPSGATPALLGIRCPDPADSSPARTTDIEGRFHVLYWSLPGRNDGGARRT